jgi:peptidylprolyl isomerase
MAAAGKATRVYLDIDVDGHQAAFQRCCDFVSATNLRYGWSSKFLADLGGSERARIAEAYEADFDWRGRGRIELEPARHTRVVINLFTDAAPNCCENFAALCTGEKGKAKGSGCALHYAGSHFHRLVPGAILQGGDFAHSNGSGGESIWGGRFKDDKAALKLKHSRRGLLSMCNTGPNSNGSQFFITLAPQPKLDGKHCVFGEIVEGLEVLELIERTVLPVDKASGVPDKRILIVGGGRLP